MAHESSVSGMVAEQELRLVQETLRWQRWMLFANGLLCVVLFFLSSATGRMGSFRHIGLFSGLYCLCNSTFTLWQEAIPDLKQIKRRGGYREYFHAAFCTIAYVLFCLIEDDNNKDLVEMGGLYVYPLSVAWESRGEGGSHILPAYLWLHTGMTILRFTWGGAFWSSGWQKVFISCNTNFLILRLCEFRHHVSMDKDLLASICSTIQRLLGFMCDGYCVVDNRGVIVGADVKLLSLLGRGTDGTTLKGHAFKEFLLDSPLSTCAESEGLRTLKFRAGDGRPLTAEVYTVASTLTQSIVNGMLGCKCLDIGHGPGTGVLRAVRHLSNPVSETLTSACSSSLPAPPELVPGPNALGPDPHPRGDPDEHAERGWSLPALFEVGPASESEPDLLSAPSSVQAATPGGGFFPTARALGIGVGEYTKVELASRSSQGTVWRVRGPGGGDLAMKELRLPGVLWRRDFPANLRQADREVRCLKRLQWASSVIVQTFDCWLQEDMLLCIVMEWLPLTLASLLFDCRSSGRGPPPIEDTCRWQAHIVAGIAVIHSEGIMHRDLKPSNLLLTADRHRCKVADLGLSREVHRPVLAEQAEGAAEFGSSAGDSETASLSSRYTARCGTRGFQSPEILQGGIYGPATDVFSMGCVLLEMLSLGRPSALPATPGAAAKLLSEPPAISATAGAAPATLELRRLCLQMLQEDPAERPTALALARAGALRPPLDALSREHQDLGRALQLQMAEEGPDALSEDALGNVRLDGRGFVRAWSPGVADALGVPPENAFGRRMLEAFVAPADRAAFSRAVGPVIRGLSREAHGPLTLQGASRTLPLVATVRVFGQPPRGPWHGPGQPCHPGLVLELHPARPSSPKVWEARPLVEPPSSPVRASGEAEALSPVLHASDVPHVGPATSIGDAAIASGLQSTPAHLVSLRPASPEGLAEREGLHERQVRAWSSVPKAE